MHICKTLFLEQVMKPQELLFPTQTFFSVVWTKSNMLKRKLTTTVSEWVTSVTVRQQLQCQEAAEWIQSLLLSLLVPLRCDPCLPSAAAVHCQCQCSGWDTSSGNDLPTYETWEENRRGGGGSFKSLGFLLCQHVCNQLGGEKKNFIPAESDIADILRVERRNNSSLVLKHFEIWDEVADSKSVASSFGWVGGTDTLLGGSQTGHKNIY